MAAENQEQEVDQSNGGNDDEGQDNAAKTIQRRYRGHKSRRETRGCGISAAGRCREVLNDGTVYLLDVCSIKIF